MSITGSMYNGISGLQAQSKATLVVSNNLANSSTVGFKSSSVVFEDLFYETMSYGQTGNGVGVANVSTDFSQGSYQSTGSSTDLAVSGDGYFIVNDPKTNALYYTRAGNFEFDEQGYLVDSDGNRVQGWGMEEGNPTGAIGDIQVDDSQSPPQETSSVQFAMNLNTSADDNSTAVDGSSSYTALFDLYSVDSSGDPALDQSRYEYQTAVNVYDEAGGTHEVTAYMDKVGVDAQGNSVWEYTVASAPGDDQRAGFTGTEAAGLLMTGTITFSSSGTMSSMTAFTPREPTDAEITAGTYDPKDSTNWQLAEFDDAGLPVMNANFSGGTESQQISLNLGMVNKDHDTGSGWTAGVDSDGDGSFTLADLYTGDPANPDVAFTDLPSFNDANVEYNATTSYEASSSTLGVYQDGYPTGTLLNVTVDQNGVMYGSYSNGQEISLYTVALSDFANEGGLSAQGGNKFTATTTSGEPRIGTANTAGLGGVNSCSLEISNVDMATEMTNLIILQSAYQANSKVITTADTLLQTAISLKS